MQRFPERFNTNYIVIRLEKRMKRTIRIVTGIVTALVRLRIRMSYFSLRWTLLHSASEHSRSPWERFSAYNGTPLSSSATYEGLLLGLGVRGNSGSYNRFANLSVWPLRLFHEGSTRA